jgi:hypothetical protein
VDQVRKVYLFVKVGVNTTFDPEELKSIVTDSLIRAGFESVRVSSPCTFTER